MKAFGKIIICIIVVILAIGIALLINNKNNDNTTNANISNTTNKTNTNQNQTTNDNNYIGLEENVEPIEKEEQQKTEEDTSQSEQTKNEETKTELIGEDKAVDIVKTKYATNGQTVTFDHKEGENYVIKVNEGTAVTWYLVDGSTWEAEEY